MINISLRNLISNKYNLFYLTVLFMATSLMGCNRQSNTNSNNSDKEVDETDTTAEVKTMNDSIQIALHYQKNHYPVSQLRDVYKNFMQDFFGPGHILNDTAASSRYLKSELAETKQFDGPDYEPTGFRGNFYRVNIGLIADGTIPYDKFFNTFVNSIQGITPPDSAYWMNIWDSIDTEIGKMGWKFENEETDRKSLEEQFGKGDFIVHHSKTYNDAVNFHYRIISRDAFEKTILPLLEAKSNTAD